jgi:aminoglycoside phosphotransferase family enzyme/gluconate kinase
MTTFADQRRLIAALQSAHAAQVIETHISWVLLIGDFAYKIKKAVDLGFLNYLALSSRKHFCEEELRLNRRTAPELYMEVVAIGGSADAPQFGVLPAIEYAVKMRRFPDDALMDGRLRQGRVEPAHIDALASTVAIFHERAATVDAQMAFGNAATIRAAALQNFGQMRTLLKDAADLRQVATLEKATMREWEIRAAQFEERRSAGRVRECHGDLHLGNIALIDDVPVPFDGIEFAPALRWIDVLDEVAFTMMDLLQHERADLAWRFLNAYLEATGDYAGVGGLRFYLAYRAAVRAKVAAIRAGQSAGSDRSRDMKTCRAHLLLAQRCLTERHPALIITHGLPGSGKTTIAQYVLEQLGAVRIRSDVERKRSFGLSALEGSRKLNVDIYSRQATAQTYDRLLALARELLRAGHTVVVDAAFLRSDEREQFRALAQAIASPFVIATLDADEYTLRARLRKRRHDASEADVNVLEKLQAVQQPLSAHEQDVAVRFSTMRPPQSGENALNWRRLLKFVYAL